MTEPSGFLGLEQRIAPGDAGPLAAALAERAGRARASQVAYPGVWLRDDVYAIHGHYSDLHATVPTFERLAAGAMARWVGPPPRRGGDARRLRGRARRRFTPGCTPSRSAPTTRWSAPAPAPPRARGSGARRQRPPRCARAPPRCAPASRPPWPRSTRSGSARWSATCPAPALRRGYLHGIVEMLAPPRRARPARDLRPLAPLRPVAGRRPRRVDHPRRRPRAQHRLVGLPAALPPRQAEPLALLARHGRRHRGRASRRGWCACWHSPRSRGEARRVARHARPDAQVEHARVWCAWMTSS